VATTDELKQRIDLHDLAEKLGLERPHSRGNYKSPTHEEKNPSLSIFAGGTRWKDHSTNAFGTCIDLVMYVEGCEVDEAIRRLHELYNIPLDKPKDEPRRELSTAEYVANRCTTAAEELKAYLVDERKITEFAVDLAIKGRSLGFNAYTNPKFNPYELGHGGPAVACIVRSTNPGRVMAVDMRYLDPELNGGCKTQTIGEKYGHPWFSDLRRVKQANRVYIVESAINALSIEGCDIPYTTAVATRGTGNVENIDWRFLIGKEVVIAMDNDEPNKKTGYCAGEKAAWAIYDQLTALNIATMLVEQQHWDSSGWNDINDILQAEGPEQLRRELKRLQHWVIPGMHGGDGCKGKRRVYLPPHDYAQYWRFRAKSDFTTWVSKVDKDEESGEEKPSFEDLCGFRVASLSRVQVASALSMMSGDQDAQPRVLFSVSVQAPRHGAKLMRRVFEDDQLHNVDHWRKFGPVYKPSQFLRMINILERGADLGARHAINFVGLAWRDGDLVVNQGPDCYFTLPEKQCPYHNLTFPSGSVDDAKVVIKAYQTTFKRNAALLPLVWGLGGHLKAFLGFWPHMVMQADKGAGKSTLIKRLERTLVFTMFSGQSLQTEWRLLTSISSTSHPVGWEEISARRQDVIDKAVAMLQESYQHTATRRGADMTEFVLSAPVLLAGEDVPVKSLLGKVVRTELGEQDMGPLMREDLPTFPVQQWLTHLATHYRRDQVRETYERYRKRCQDLSRASGEDKGAERMAGNYAGLLLAWSMLCEFAGIDEHQGGFIDDVLAQMNSHIAETSQDREPWVWIMEIALSEIAAGKFRHPYTWDHAGHFGEQEECLMVRTSHIMDHIAHEHHLRDRWNALPVKSDRVFKRQLKQAGVVVEDGTDNGTVERTINGRRVSNLCAISLGRLEGFGLFATPNVSSEKF
jgi:hypothetical protein